MRRHNKMSHDDMYRRLGLLTEEKRDRRGREAVGDGATGRSVKAIQLVNTKKRRPSG